VIEYERASCRTPETTFMAFGECGIHTLCTAEDLTTHERLGDRSAAQDLEGAVSRTPRVDGCSHVFFSDARWAGDANGAIAARRYHGLINRGLAQPRGADHPVTPTSAGSTPLSLRIANQLLAAPTHIAHHIPQVAKFANIIVTETI